MRAIPKPALDDAYAQGMVSADEYQRILHGMGLDANNARQVLADLHAANPQLASSLPEIETPEVGEPIPQRVGPIKRPKSAAGPTMAKHPIETGDA